MAVLIHNVWHVSKLLLAAVGNSGFLAVKLTPAFSDLVSSVIRSPPTSAGWFAGLGSLGMSSLGVSPTK